MPFESIANLIARVLVLKHLQFQSLILNTFFESGAQSHLEDKTQLRTIYILRPTIPISGIGLIELAGQFFLPGLRT
jgi:hypothetical protein